MRLARRGLLFCLSNESPTIPTVERPTGLRSGQPAMPESGWDICEWKMSRSRLPRLNLDRLPVGGDAQPMTKIAIGAMAALALTACASVPMESPADSAAGKTFAPPRQGMASLYVYRTGIFAGAYSIAVTLGQRNLGALASDTWFLIELEPGEYDVRCNAENSASAIVRIGPGETRFVDVSPAFGVMAPRCSVVETNAQQGQQGVLAGNRARAIR